MFAAGDKLRIGRVVLRGTASAIDHAHATLPAALARTHWPADEAIIVVRRLTVGGTAAELPARAAAAAHQLTHRAADPWSPAADSAEAVRFRDALDYRACLVRDLLTGTAAHRWLWRHRAALLARPEADALADLLSEDALALPALLDRPALRASLPALWRTLDAPGAREVLEAIGSATGWQGAIDRALDPTTHERRADEPKAESSNIAAVWMGMIEVDAGIPPSDIRRKALRFSALRSALPDKLPPSDPRVVLQAVLSLWTHAPATLAAAGEALRATAEMLAAGQRLSSLPFKGVEQGFRGATLRACGTAERSGDSRAGVGMGQADIAETHPPPSLPLEEGGTMRPSRHRPFACGVDDHGGDKSAHSPSPAPSRVSSVAASPATLPPATDADFHTRGGGFFFLLNVLNLPALRDWRATLAEPQAGWRELVRLARWLDFTPDAPLAAFLVDACALETDDDPAAALATLPPGADPAPVRHAAQRHYGEAALAAALTERPAHIRATASHLDVHLRLAAVDLDIRRTGLDLDPGWLPWLGRVVRFHYDSGGFSS